ncbi:MAG: 16S rRNA (guanine(527)-N(7))-methyltransferase RsmG [Ruminococcaceae bacterium]|nr:16S rRNA (guanine(527)-N(7))-methyltransferase RsmG [Oscillospiraceae bacterium]
MEHQNFIDLLYNTFEENGMKDLLDDNSAELLYRFAALLVETNKHTNLTAITDEKGIILKHFADSAAISRHIPQGAAVLDVGCGAGFPSVPLAIIRSDLAITSLDSTGKKIDFVLSAKEKLGLENLNAVCARAEEYAALNRESFDVCTSRAVARLNVLSELCVPFIKVGGLFVAMKSDKGAEEAKEAEEGIKKLGAAPTSVSLYSLTCEETAIDREIRIYKKTAPTPKQYPRKYSQILKKPL